MGNGKKSVMVSACLLGINCRYDGHSKPVPNLTALLPDYEIIPFCPERLVNMAIPRPPAEICNGDGTGVWNGTAKVFNQNGLDLSREFRLGAQRALEMFLKERPELVIFKANSPSCGVNRIYDGNFSGTLREGDGVTVVLFRQAGANIMTETEFLESPSVSLE